MSDVTGIVQAVTGVAGVAIGVVSYLEVRRQRSGSIKPLGTSHPASSQPPPSEPFAVPDETISTRPDVAAATPPPREFSQLTWPQAITVFVCLVIFAEVSKRLVPSQTGQLLVSLSVLSVATGVRLILRFATPKPRPVLSMVVLSQFAFSLDFALRTLPIAAGMRTALVIAALLLIGLWAEWIYRRRMART